MNLTLCQKPNLCSLSTKSYSDLAFSSIMWGITIHLFFYTKSLRVILLLYYPTWLLSSPCRLYPSTCLNAFTLLHCLLPNPNYLHFPSTTDPLLRSIQIPFPCSLPNLFSSTVDIFLKQKSNHVIALTETFPQLPAILRTKINRQSSILGRPLCTSPVVSPTLYVL